MKAPEKIYIEQKAIMYELVNTEPCKPDDIEYIRKDALLEWAKEKYDKAFRLHLKKGDRYHYGLGKMDAYKILIDKIHKL